MSESYCHHAQVSRSNGFLVVAMATDQPWRTARCPNGIVFPTRDDAHVCADALPHPTMIMTLSQYRLHLKMRKLADAN